jgi:hypothetical protein
MAIFNDFEFDFDMNDFDIDNDLSLSILPDGKKHRYIKPKMQRIINQRNIKYRYAEDLANEITIEKNCRYNAIISGQFIFGDFLEALIVKNNYLCESITISTLSLNQNNIDSLNNLIVGNYVRELNLIISAYFYSHERLNLLPYIYRALDIGDRFQLAVARSHCKITQFRTECGKKIVIHGSANFRSSDNLEQITIEENEELYDFYEEIHSSILRLYKTIDKEIRGDAAWQAVARDQGKVMR